MKKRGRGGGWEVLSPIFRMSSPWLTMIGERLRDDDGQELDYWRIEKPDGVMVLTIQNGKLLLPKQTYRPGVGRYSLDFCAGRLPVRTTPEEAAKSIVSRELNVRTAKPIISLKPINDNAWYVDSSFTNVQAYGFVAELAPEAVITEENLGGAYPLTMKGTSRLLDDLVCLQCRAFLREWLATVNLV